MEIGRKIYLLRQNAGLSQEVMGIELGISQTTYSRIENGKIDPKLGTLKKICDILNADITKVLSEETSIDRFFKELMRDN